MRGSIQKGYIRIADILKLYEIATGNFKFQKNNKTIYTRTNQII